MWRKPPYQAGYGVVPQRFDEHNLSAPPQDTMYLPHGMGEFEMMQDGDSEHNVEAAIVEFEIVGVHLAEVAGHSQFFGLGPSDFQLRLRNVDTRQSSWPVTIPEQAPLPGLRTDLENPSPRRVAHRQANRLVTPMPSDPVV